MTYTIWSIGNNGLDSFSATYKGSDGNEIKLLGGRGEGDADQDSVTSAPHVLPSFPTNQPTTATTREYIDIDPIVTNAPSETAKGKLPTGTQSPDPTLAVTSASSLKPTKLPTETPTPSQSSKPTSSSTTPTHDPTLVTSNAPTEMLSKDPTQRPSKNLTRIPIENPAKLPGGA